MFQQLKTIRELQTILMHIVKLGEGKCTEKIEKIKKSKNKSLFSLNE